MIVGQSVFLDLFQKETSCSNQLKEAIQNQFGIKINTHISSESNYWDKEYV